MEKDAILTVRDVAELLKIGQKTAYTMVQQGVLPAFRVRGQWRFRRADIEAWIAKQVTAAAEEPRTAEAKTTEDTESGSAMPDDERVEHRNPLRGPIGSTSPVGPRSPSDRIRRR